MRCGLGVDRVIEGKDVRSYTEWGWGGGSVEG